MKRMGMHPSPGGTLGGLAGFQSGQGGEPGILLRPAVAGEFVRLLLLRTLTFGGKGVQSQVARNRFLSGIVWLLRLHETGKKDREQADS
jgi:hypothetical protein